MSESLSELNRGQIQYDQFAALEQSDAAKMLVESAKLFSRTLDQSRAYHILEEIVRRTMVCDGLLVSSYNPVERLIRCVHAWVDHEHVDVSVFPPMPFNPDPGSGMQSEVIRSGEARLFGDVEERVETGKGKYFQLTGEGKLEELPKGSKPKAKSALMAPIRLDDQVIGVVQVMADRAGAYGDQHLVFVEGLAFQMAAAEKNAELFSQMQEEISERIKAEQALLEREEEVRQLNSDLEQRVIERTVQLQLANDEMEAFCYSVSHDLRQPLRAICIAAAIVLRDSGEEIKPEVMAHLEHMDASSKKMSRLIDDLLTFSRLGRKPMTQSRVNLSELAGRIRDGIRSRGSYDVSITIDPGLEAECDVEMVVLALDSLLNNGVKFSSGRRDAQVHFGSEATPTGTVYFVRDNGVGFEQEFVHKLFKPFERLHREEDFPGTGIGLANVKRIIERHGGRVWARGAPGEGAVFYFTLGYPA